jgi:hypothetical protein
MIQCTDCEYFHRGPGGQAVFSCDPFSTIKEPACLAKWQLIKLEVLARSHQATLDMYQRLAPFQEKLFRQMERELDDQEEADRWKYGPEDEEDEPEDEDRER